MGLVHRVHEQVRKVGFVGSWVNRLEWIVMEVSYWVED